MTAAPSDSAAAASPVLPPVRSRAADVAAGLIAAVLFAVCLWLFTRANDFPHEYHPDEPGKGVQVIEGRRNYRHPQLLLETASLLAEVRGQRPSLPKRTSVEKLPNGRELTQHAVETGRDVSAAFAAMAVALLALTAYRSAGLPAMLLCGASLALCQPLIVNAHFMKEDAALVLGLSAVALAGRLAWERRGAESRVRLRSATLLGAACALAVSGKYVGVVAVLPAVWLLLASDRGTADRRPTRRQLLGRFGIGFVALAAVVNWRVFKNIGTFVSAVGNQAVDGVVEHKGLTMARPTAYFARAVVETLPTYVVVPAIAMAVVGGVAAWRGRRWVAVVGLSPLAYLALVSFSSAPNHRHALPVVVLAHFAAAVGVGRLLSGLKLRPLVAAAAAVPLAAAVAYAEVPAARALVGEFAADTRVEVARAMAETLPADAVVLQDAAAELQLGPAAGQATVPGTIVTREFAADFAPGDELAAKGITHVVVCDEAYARYFNPDVVPVPEAQPDYDRRRAWYQRMLGEPQLIEKRPRVRTHSVLSPEIRVYDVRPRRSLSGPLSPVLGGEG